MARASLSSDDPWREQIGRAIQRAFKDMGWSQKEAAGKLGRDEAQVARWLAGTERPQLDTLFAVEELRGPLVVALARLSQAEIVTEIRLRRPA